MFESSGGVDVSAGIDAVGASEPPANWPSRSFCFSRRSANSRPLLQVAQTIARHSSVKTPMMSERLFKESGISFQIQFAVPLLEAVGINHLHTAVAEADIIVNVTT